MTKITTDHLARSAIVYVRQSTAYQVANNTESGRRQYSLVERARRLGWSDVQVIDDDLGRSGGGIVRPGFEKLLTAICERTVGAVLSLEASRLARNGRDWHTLLEFGGLVGTLIVDEDGIYDPRRCAYRGEIDSTYTTLKLAHQQRIGGGPSQDLEDQRRPCEEKDRPHQANQIALHRLFVETLLHYSLRTMQDSCLRCRDI